MQSIRFISLSFVISICSVILVIFTSYLIFLTSPKLFTIPTNFLNYSNFRYEEISTNSNPLFPEITFSGVSIEKDNALLDLDVLLISVNFLNVFSNKRILNSIYLEGSGVDSEDYLFFLPNNLKDLKKNLRSIIQEGYIENFDLKIINNDKTFFLNNLSLKDITLSVNKNNSIISKKATVSVNVKETSISLTDGYFNNFQFSNISASLDHKNLQLRYLSFHENIQSFVEQLVPLGSLNLNQSINLNTRGFINIRENEGNNFGYLSFSDEIQTEFFKDKLKISSSIFFRDFNSFFSQTSVFFDNSEIKLYASGTDIQQETKIDFFTEGNGPLSIKGTFDDKELELKIEGDKFNSKVISDPSGFFRVEMNDTNFSILRNFSRNENQEFIFPNSKFRFIGKNISFDNLNFDEIDFYYLKNGEVLTINDINVKSDFLKISENKDMEKAYFAIDTSRDFFKIKGTYEIKDIHNIFDLNDNTFVNFLKTDVNIQWNEIQGLRNIEGELEFLFKDFRIKQKTQNTVLLNLLSILNISSLFREGGDRDSDFINFNRGEGRLIFAKDYARTLEDFKFNSDFGDINWSGYIYKNELGYLENLDLDLILDINLDKNLPWYAAIFGGIGVAAGTALIGNVFEDQFERISKIEFEVDGNLEEPKLRRL